MLIIAGPAHIPFSEKLEDRSLAGYQMMQPSSWGGIWSKGSPSLDTEKDGQSPWFAWSEGVPRTQKFLC